MQNRPDGSDMAFSLRGFCSLRGLCGSISTPFDDS